MLLLILTSCSTDEGDISSERNVLEPLGEYVLDVPEPSGLSPGSGGHTLWTVSDQTGKAYEISFTGERIRETGFIDDDLEGIAFNPLTGDLWVLSERNSRAFRCDTNGQVFQEIPLVLGGAGNKGPEGITLDETGRVLWMVNEADPTRMVRYELDSGEQQEWELHVADDLSGICRHPLTGNLWVVSDQSQALVEVDSDGNALSEYSLPIVKAEGIAFSSGGDSLFIVSDSQETLTLFTFSEGQ